MRISNPAPTRSNSGIALLALMLIAPLAFAAKVEKPQDIQHVTHPDAPAWQTKADADAKSEGCVSCHTTTDQATMHASPAVVLGCADCHGGNPQVVAPDGLAASVHGVGQHGNSTPGHREYPGEYRALMDQAHVLPLYPQAWHHPSSANPERSYTLLNKEAPEYIRFVNPSDLRIAREACGACHLPIIEAAERSIMATSAMLWGGASYNNGILPYKRYILGEAYTRDGMAAGLTNPVPIDEAMKKRGVLPKLYPLPAWEVIPPADVFRVFERGGRNIANLFAETGLPNALGQIQRLEEPGRPDIRQSNRGPGTGQRVAIPVLNIHKTRLNDPNMWFLGTNDNPGDFRSSGCASCHVVYANDRDPRHSGPYAEYGHFGETQTADPTIPRDEKGHPLKHEFTRSIPTSTCMICHMHQPNMFINSMLGYTMWDYESDAPKMWPSEQRYPSHDEMRQILDRNPEEAAIRGKWGDLQFLRQVWDMNPEMEDTQFADYHGHGWNFRAIFKRDRQGHLLDADGEIVSNDDPKKFQKAVHMASIHIDVGMHCVDCHFAQDMHGNGHIYGEVAQAVEIQCQDCHGTADAYPTLRTTNVAAPPKGTNLEALRNPDGKRRFEWVGGKLIQRSLVTPGLEWEMSLVKDSVDPVSGHYNAKSARAKLVSKDTDSQDWGLGVAKEDRAHNDDKMLCYSCHTSWTTSCGGCHLPIQANAMTDRHHYEGGQTRNYASYNPQVARDDVFMLGVHGEAKDYKIAPVRSSSALVLSSTNSNREKIYIQQPPISAPGYSSQAFAPHYPHTERKTETKTCTDCHLAAENDNNAIMAQLLLQGTKYMDFLGFNAYIGMEGAIAAVEVTEWDEPQAVIGSYLHRYAYPDWYQAHQQRGQRLETGHEHRAGTAACIQHRGEYLYVAEGSKGFRVYDIASVSNKGFSQRIISAPFSPLGQTTQIKSSNATCMALPTTQPIHPDRNQGDLMRVENLEQPFHPIYNYAFITDSEEGLIVVDVNTLNDGDPRNNQLDRALTWNADGVLNGARHITIAGYWFYIATPDAVVVLNMNDPLAPQVAARIPLPDVRATAMQFRYLLASVRGGVQVVDITHPDRPRIVDGAFVALDDPQRIHIARTYAYVAARHQGLAILDVTKFEQPRIYQIFNAGGEIADAYDVTVASTNASPFAYVADGQGGLKVVQVFSPETQPNFYGFAATPAPELIAHYPTQKPVLSLARALERDRAVDETGGQIAVLGRIGSRPFNQAEMQKMYLDHDGLPWYVTDVPGEPTRPGTAQTKPKSEDSSAGTTGSASAAGTPR